jgi:hypothetical protein
MAKYDEFCFHMINLESYKNEIYFYLIAHFELSYDDVQHQILILLKDADNYRNEICFPYSFWTTIL